MTEHARTAGDDVIVQVRVRRANLPALEAGVQLGVDSLTGGAIELQLVPREDGVHELLVVTNPFPMLATPDPVDAVERTAGRPMERGNSQDDSQ